MSEAIGSDPAYQRFLELYGALADLGSIEAIISWDQEVNMPEAAVQDRAMQRSTLARLRHQLLLSDEYTGLIDQLASQVDLDSDEEIPSMIRLAKRSLDKARQLPDEFVARRSRVVSMAMASWQKAKASDDFSIFRDDLKQIIDLKREEAEYLGFDEHPYDALLDAFEPEMKTAQIDRYFDELKAELVPLVQAIADCPQVDDAFLGLDYDERKTWDFGLELLDAIGYSMKRGRLDVSAHPFTTTLGKNDVRITTWSTSHLTSCLFATIHEGGHGVHAQGEPQQWARTPLAGSPSFSFSESQSRLFENVVGRSKAFWSHHYPRLQQVFPGQLGGVSLDQFYRAINKVQPSFIRVEADELTYHLHIMLRFELEKMMLTGQLDVDDLPDVWNAKMKELLGVEVYAPSVGCLQDIHWSGGMMGYFPSYSMGSVLAVQLYDLAVSEDPRIEEEIEKGSCDSLREWMRDRVYRYGRTYPPAQLIERLTGGPLTAKPFLEYARRKYAPIYGF